MYKGKAEIVEIIRETHDTKTYRLRLDGQMPFKPGQFAVLVIPPELGGGPQYSRAYSMASSPTENLIDLTMNVVGTVTQKMDSFEAGTKINLQGPFGRFVFEEEKHKDVVVIAGGTGIAPFRSMWRYIQDKKLSNKFAVLVSYKTSSDVIYEKELNEIQKQGAKVYVTITRESENSQWKGNRGRITAETIKQLCSLLEGKTFFICGSNKMNDDMTQTLLSLGVPKEQIITEKWGDY